MAGNLPPSGVTLIAENANVFFGDMDRAGNAVRHFGDETDRASGGISKAGEIMTGALRKVGELAVEAFMMAGRAVAGFISDSISVAGDFEQTLNVLQATSGATGDELAAVGAKAKELGADMTLPATSAVDAGKAMLELSKAGFTVQQSMDAAKGVLQLAAAANIEEARAAEINANAINAFNLKATDSVFVSDLLAASANASSVEITDVAQSYQMAGAVFASFQGPVVGSKEALIDLTTAVGLLGNAGIKGSDAGTSLKQALLQLTGPSDKAKGMMQELAASIGVSGDIAYTAQGQMRSFPEILGLTARATAGLTDEKRNQYITDIFGADASRAILILMKQGPAAWDAMTAAVTRQGAAADLAKAQTQGLKGAFEGMKSQVETLQLTLGQVFLPILADLLNNYISPAIAKVTAFAESILSANDPLLALVQSVDGLLPGLGSIIGYLVAFVQDGDALNDFLITTPPLFQGLVGAVQSAIPVVQQIAIFLADNLEPILFGIGTAITVVVVPALLTAVGAFLAVAAPIVALVAAGALLYSAWTSDFLGIRTTVTEWWTTTLQPIFSQVVTWLATNIPVAIQASVQFWTGTLQPALVAVGGFVTGTLFPIFGSLVTWLGATIPPIITALAALWTDILQPALNAVWTFISGSLIPIFAAIFRVEFAIAQKVGEALAALWSNVIQPALSAAGSYISTTLTPVFTAIGDYLSATFGPILGDLATWLGTATSGFSGINKAVQDAIGWLNGLADKIANLKLPDWLQSHSPTPFEIGLWGIADALKAVAGLAGDDLQNALKKLADSFSFQATIARTMDSMDTFAQDLTEKVGQFSGLGAVWMTQQAQAQGEQAQAQIQEALRQAKILEQFDPKAGSQFFKLRADQIKEMATLQSDLLQATDQAGKDALQTKIARIMEAQRLELNAFLSQVQGIEGIAGQLGSVSPPASSGQIAAGNTNNYYGGASYNLGVTTSQSPAVVQQSYHVMRALAAQGA